MYLDRKCKELIKKGIKDYKFMKEEINYKINKGYDFDKITDYILKFKGIEITNREEYGDCAYLDFIYNNLYMCVCWTKEKNYYVSNTFEIYDKNTGEYAVEDFLTVEEYEKLLNTPKEEVLNNLVADLKYYDSRNDAKKYETILNKIAIFLKEEY